MSIDESSKENQCECVSRSSLFLQYHLTSNPLSCGNCNLEVSLSSIKISSELSDEINDWLSEYSVLYKLWLYSAEFEDLASHRLSDVNDKLNVNGLKLAKKISKICNCYYWWFDEVDTETMNLTVNCPKCNGILEVKPNNFNLITKVCNKCRIVMAEEIMPVNDRL